MATEIFFDGLCEPNPNGIATYGYVVYQSGKPIRLDSGFVGKGKGMTNNVAEYSALLEALRWLSKQELNNEIVVRGDSRLVIEQLSGKWKIRSKTSKEFIPKIKSLLDGKNFKFAWIPREENKEADKLSKQAYSSHLMPQKTVKA